MPNQWYGKGTYLLTVWFGKNESNGCILRGDDDDHHDQEGKQHPRDTGILEENMLQLKMHSKLMLKQ